MALWHSHTGPVYGHWPARVVGLPPTSMPVLGYWHLQNKSRMAAAILPQVESTPLPQAVLQLILRIRDFAERHRTDRLMEIAADGRIDHLERETFDTIVAELDAVVQAVMQLKYAEG